MYWLFASFLLQANLLCMESLMDAVKLIILWRHHVPVRPALLSKVAFLVTFCVISRVVCCCCTDVFLSLTHLFLCCVNMCQDVERTLLKCSGVGKASCQSWNWKAVVVVQRRGAWMPPALSAISECSDQRHWLRTWPHSNVTDKLPKAGQSVVISIIDYGLDLVAMSQTNLLKLDRVWWSGSLTTDLTSQQCHRQTS